MMQHSAALLILLLALALPACAAPYRATAIAVPGRIQAEDYDRGGPGIAYFDTDAANNGGAYRPAEGVDVQPSTDGTFNVGWTQPGEWLTYSINVATAGAYRFELRVACPQPAGPVQLSINGAPVGSVAVPNTGDWGVWQTVSLSNVQLAAGAAVLTVTFTGDAGTGGPNLNWVHVYPNAYVAPTPPAYPTTLDGAFFDQVFVGGLTAPTDMAFASDGRIFISEKQGTIRVWKNGGLLATPAIDLIAEVQNAGDKGLLSIVLHPFFATNNWIYLLYAVDPQYGQPDETEFTPVLHRLVRYTFNGDVLDPASRTIILGKSLSEGLVSCASTHTAGKMRFAPDNTLMFTFGDGGHYEYMDLGNDAACVSGGFITAEQDIGAFRAQSLLALQGKVLRIDPDTGLGVPSNPWYDPAKPIQSRIWALGHRNPFRWSFKPTDDGSIVLLVGDVGNGDYEDLTEVRMGDNSGWPCYEGRYPAPGYYAARADFCQDVGTLVGNQRWPLLDFSHTDATKSYPVGYNGNAITSATMYVGQSYPPIYQGAVFVSDHSRGWVSAFFLDLENSYLNSKVMFNPTAVSAVTIESSPAIYNFDLFYFNLNAGQLRRIQYGNAPPVAAVAAAPTSGNYPLTVRFSADGTFDAQGRTMALAWDFGDGATATEANPVHTYMSAGDFTARLTVSAGTQTASATVKVNTRAPRPAVRVSMPAPFSTYPAGSNVKFAADLSANTAPVTLSWELQLVHNAHYHPQTAVSTEAQPTWFLEGNTPDGQRISYRVVATATNSQGYTVADMLSVVPAGSPNGAPTAAFILSTTAGAAPLPVTVDSLGSADPDGDILFYTWNWGDGTLEAQGTDARHIYAYGGVYTITLTAMDNYGATATATRQVTVSGPPPPPSTAPPTLPPSTAPPATSAPPSVQPSPSPPTPATPAPPGSSLSPSPAPPSLSPAPTTATTLAPSHTPAQSDTTLDSLSVPPAQTFAGNLHLNKALYVSTSLKTSSTRLLSVAGTLKIAPEAHLNVTLSDVPKDGQVLVIAEAASVQGAFASVSVATPADSNCTLVTGSPETLQGTRVAVLFRVESSCTTSKRRTHPWVIGLIVAVVVVAVAVAVLTVCLVRSAGMRKRVKDFVGAGKK